MTIVPGRFATIEIDDVAVGDLAADIRSMIGRLETMTLTMEPVHELVLTPEQEAWMKAAALEYAKDSSQAVRLLRFTASADWAPCVWCGKDTRARRHGRPAHILCDKTPQTSRYARIGGIEAFSVGAYRRTEETE